MKLAVAAASLILGSLFEIAIAAPRLKVGETVLTGVSTTAGVDLFAGIPFAEPPIGPLRFRPPIPMFSLQASTFNATSFGSSCLQPPSFFNLSLLSEDCLTISVYKPSSVKSSDNLPVLFWTYGGAWIYGSSSVYDGTPLVTRSIERETPIIYVAFNYRLGPFGWPQGQEAEDQGILNLGLLDQKAALAWVHANIHYFGGDPAKVTVFGESAGSINTALLYLSFQLDGLARAAIFQSGQANSVLNPRASFREDVWRTLVQGVPSCSDTITSASNKSSLSCMREAGSDAVYSSWIRQLEASNEFVRFLYFPTIDPGPQGMIPDFPSRLYRRGRLPRLPFLSGTNVDEGTYFALESGKSTEAAVRSNIIDLLSPSVVPAMELNSAVDRIFELYPDVPSLGSPFGTGAELFGLPSVYKQHSAILGDLMFDAPRRMWMQRAASVGVKAYGYQFAQPQPLVNPALGAYHSSEILFVFGAPPDPSVLAKNLSTTMMDYWISFTVSLDPNDHKGMKRPRWAPYSTSSQVLLQFHETNVTLIPDTYRKEQLDYINSVPLVFRH